MWRDLDILVYEIHLECLCKQVPYNQIKKTGMNTKHTEIVPFSEVPDGG